MRAALTVLAAAGLFAGCGRSDSPDGSARVPTRGRVVAGGGKAAIGAVLVFHPAGAAPGSLPPRAVVAADGSFAVRGPDGGAGLPPGDYAVTVEWRVGGENGEAGRGLVAEKYARPAATPLKAAVRPGPDGACVLPAFALTP